MKASCLNLAFNLLNRNLHNWYHMYRERGRGRGEKIRRTVCVVFMKLITRGGRRNYVKFWTSMDGRGPPKTRTKHRRGTCVIWWELNDWMPSTSMKRCLSPKNQKIHQKFQHLFKANLILLANAQLLASTTTLGLAQYHSEQPLVGQLPLQLTKWTYIEETSMQELTNREVYAGKC